MADHKSSKPLAQHHTCTSNNDDKVLLPTQSVESWPILKSYLLTRPSRQPVMISWSVARREVTLSLESSSTCVQHRYQHYRFHTGNQAPFRLSVCFALIVHRIYLYYFVCFACLEFKAASTRAPTQPGLKTSRVILARVKSLECRHDVLRRCLLACFPPFFVPLCPLFCSLMLKPMVQSYS